MKIIKLSILLLLGSNLEIHSDYYSNLPREERIINILVNAEADKIYDEEPTIPLNSTAQKNKELIKKTHQRAQEAYIDAFLKNSIENHKSFKASQKAGNLAWEKEYEKTITEKTLLNKQNTTSIDLSDEELKKITQNALANAISNTTLILQKQINKEEEKNNKTLGYSVYPPTHTPYKWNGAKQTLGSYNKENYADPKTTTSQNNSSKELSQKEIEEALTKIFIEQALNKYKEKNKSNQSYRFTVYPNSKTRTENQTNSWNDAYPKTLDENRTKPNTREELQQTRLKHFEKSTSESLNLDEELEHLLVPKTSKKVIATVPKYPTPQDFERAEKESYKVFNHCKYTQRKSDKYAQQQADKAWQQSIAKSTSNKNLNITEEEIKRAITEQNFNQQNLLKHKAANYKLHDGYR